MQGSLAGEKRHLKEVQAPQVNIDQGGALTLLLAQDRGASKTDRKTTILDEQND